LCVAIINGQRYTFILKNLLKYAISSICVIPFLTEWKKMLFYIKHSSFTIKKCGTFCFFFCCRTEFCEANELND